MKYEVILAHNRRSYQIEVIRDDGTAGVTATDYADRAAAYRAAEAKGWQPANEQVLARRQAVLGY